MERLPNALLWHIRSFLSMHACTPQTLAKMIQEMKKPMCFKPGHCVLCSKELGAASKTYGFYWGDEIVWICKPCAAPRLYFETADVGECIMRRKIIEGWWWMVIRLPFECARNPREVCMIHTAP